MIEEWCNVAETVIEEEHGLSDKRVSYQCSIVVLRCEGGTPKRET